MPSPKTDVSVATKAIIDWVATHKNFEGFLSSSTDKGNKVSQSGSLYENFIKSAFNNFSDNDLSSIFSWQGSANHPPDLIIKNGDAIEVKKVESFGDIQLNSSSLKGRIYKKECTKRIREALYEWDDTSSKDLIYCFILVDKKTKAIKKIAFIYGSCFMHFESSHLKQIIQKGIKNIFSKEKLPYNPTLIPTKELGRIQVRSDHGFTTILRSRPMWSITSPFALPNLFSRDDCLFEINTIIPIDRFENTIEAKYFKRSSFIDSDFSFLGKKVIKINYQQ